MNEQWQHVWLLLLHLLLLSKVLHTALSQADCSHRCHRCLDRCYLMVSFKSSSGCSISSCETFNVTANPWKYWALPCVSWYFLNFLVTFVSWWGKAPAFGALEDWTTDDDNDDDDAPLAWPIAQTLHVVAGSQYRIFEANLSGFMTGHEIAVSCIHVIYM